MESRLFIPEILTVGGFQGMATVGELAEEVGVYSASPDFVMKRCGPIARNILAQVPDEFFGECSRKGLYPNIDVRIHRLYPGDYPAVPGWHTDGEFRGDYHAQPELDRVVDHHHLVGTVSTGVDGVSLTEAVTEPFRAVIDEPDAGNTLWSQVHRQVETNKPKSMKLEDGVLTSMGSFTLHRATPAMIRGWRLFFRLSMWHRPYLNAEGGCISRQEQVYRLSEAKGW